ncbi:sulfatase [Horticoccus sp. 23ND18S-11]|uniref:sulfatase n=1 Tax=Horticoccus sp. 23ND18S-11 TaxID=3391832 RepID=UPI0039C9C636
MKVPCFLAALLVLAFTPRATAAAPAKPNVVLILADDLGWTDLACFGSDLHETPALDQLARDGMKFTQNYSACTVCSPTRAALLTGKYPARLHVTDWIPGAMPDNPKLLVPDWTKFLALEETTLAKVFKAAGYTTASIGKWHLAKVGTQESYPEAHGFDVNIAGTDKAQPPTYYAPWKIPTLTPEGKDGEHVTDRLADEAVKFIERSKDQPFFLYLPHFAVHTPIQGRRDLTEKYRKKIAAKGAATLTHKNPDYAALTEGLDTAVGRVRAKLAELNLTERTIIVFTSDNGGRITQGTTSNAPLRFGKASAYEGGVRVPLIVFAPRVTTAGTVSDAPVITMDLFPTLVELAGLPASAARTAVDGVSLASLLRGGAKPTRDTLFWHYPHHQHYQLGGTMPYGAIRAGDFKLVEFFNDMHSELYNVREDIGESRDLAAAQPQKVAELRARLHAWRQEFGAQMPTPNPRHDPARPEYTPPPGKAKKAAK